MIELTLLLSWQKGIHRTGSVQQEDHIETERSAGGGFRWRSAWVLEPPEPGRSLFLFNRRLFFGTRKNSRTLGVHHLATTGLTGTAESNISSDQTTCNELKRTLSGLQRHRSAATRSVEAMQTIQATSYGNLSSPHGPGRRARNRLEEARRQLASLLGVERSYVSPAAAVKATMRSSDNFAGGQAKSLILSHWNILPQKPPSRAHRIRTSHLRSTTC